MMVSRTPFRISLCGGGSDLPSYYLMHGGCVISTSIKRYIYIIVHRSFHDQIILKYGKTEIVKTPHDIQHSIFRCVLGMFSAQSIEIASISDIPSGTGLGSSSAFTVGLLNALYKHNGNARTQTELAEEACLIEIDMLKSPIGKQDQYAVAVGGLNMIHFHQNDTVSIEPILMSDEARQKLQENLVMVYTGITRSTNEILKEQHDSMVSSKQINSMKEMVNLTYNLRQILESNNFDRIGDLLNDGWKIKREMTKRITNTYIDEIYSFALRNGAEGGKLLGAGGGGFLLLYCLKERQEMLKTAIRKRMMSVEFDMDGTITYNIDKDK